MRDEKRRVGREEAGRPHAGRAAAFVREPDPDRGRAAEAAGAPSGEVAGTAPAESPAREPLRTAAGAPGEAAARRAPSALVGGGPADETVPQSGAWVWVLAFLLAGAVGGAGWLALQPPWRRWQWWRTLRAKVRGWRAAKAATGSSTTSTWTVGGRSWRPRREAEEPKRAGDLARAAAETAVTATSPVEAEGQAPSEARPALTGVGARHAERSAQVLVADSPAPGTAPDKAGSEEAKGIAGPPSGKPRRRRRITNVTLPIILRPPRGK